MTFVVTDVEGLSFTAEPGAPVRVDRLPLALAGLERTTGSVKLDGRELANEPPDRIAALGVAFVPAGRRVFGDLTVEENLTLGAYRARRDRALVGARRERVYARFPWLDRPQQLARTLSGGEQQLLVIARALMGEPAVLLLEEPSAGLADDAVQALRAALAGLDAVIVVADQRLLR